MWGLNSQPWELLLITFQLEIKTDAIILVSNMNPPEHPQEQHAQF